MNAELSFDEWKTIRASVEREYRRAYSRSVKGKELTEEVKNRISDSLVGRTAGQASRWKGEEASYQAKHMWARKHYGKPNKCEQKGSSYPKAVNKGRIMLDKPSRYEWANISGKYKRERSDWVMLCPSCHRKIDMGKEKLCVV